MRLVFYKDRWATKVTSRSLPTRRDLHRFVDIQIDENNRPYSDLYFVRFLGLIRSVLNVIFSLY
jgi:hypothetical protein